ncbi:permease-like cell division protein FtsX [Lacticaseibacillus nasuensis]|uniref:permease-like cell division protein FtsX n=1 Tax=Lacticaseibacillus nasuensis TaxID=944671 RepID=UPI002246DDC8|nr:permease-like cell division protein FtsX [Lacticaseibacillus nasuensis]MCX2454676.1 permease-like cell division protein FtsX [Lacticaseibacillus nasuensis]
MKIRTMGRHVGDSLRSLRRNGWMSLAAVSAVTVTLLLVGVFMALLLNVNRVTTQVENDVRVRVYIDANTTKADTAQLKGQLSALKDVKTVKYRSRAQELNAIVGDYGDQWKMFAGDKNPLQNVFLVDTASPKATMSVTKQAAKLDHVASASYGGQTAKRLFGTVDAVQNWGIGFTIVLLFVAVFLISNTIRITILSRSDEIGVMRLVGATNAYIRWPFLLEGAWTGLFGSLIPMAVVDAGYSVVYHSFGFTRAANGFSLFPTMPFLVWLDLALAGIGIIIGALGALISMRRFLKI